jgi:hypothetical protein
MLFKIPFLLANAYFASKALPSPLKEEVIKESERKMAPFAPYIVMAERVRHCYTLFHEIHFITFHLCRLFIHAYVWRNAELS